MVSRRYKSVTSKMYEINSLSAPKRPNRGVLVFFRNAMNAGSKMHSEIRRVWSRAKK